MLEVLIGEESDDSDFEVEKHKGRPNNDNHHQIVLKSPQKYRCELIRRYKIVLEFDPDPVPVFSRPHNVVQR
jgi:hypothetical protein